MTRFSIFLVVLFSACSGTQGGGFRDASPDAGDTSSEAQDGAVDTSEDTSTDISTDKDSGTDVDSGVGSDTSSGTGTDISTDISSDTETEGGTDPDAGGGDASLDGGPQGCAMDEIQQFDTGLCWKRCRADLDVWDGSYCNGSGLDGQVKYAVALDYCKGDYRLPTLEEIRSLLSYCSSPDGGVFECSGCADSTVCESMYSAGDNVGGGLWTSSMCDLSGGHQGQGGWVVRLDLGTGNCSPRDQPVGRSLCVRSKP